MNQIPFYLIESFVQAARGPTFEEAAGRLALTQSALSRQMLAFEDYLPQKVFTMAGRKKILTKYGETLYDLLNPKIIETQGLIHQASLIHASKEGAQIKICGRGELLEIIAAKKNLKGNIIFYPMDGEQALKHVLDRKSDLGIVSRGNNSSELIMKSYFSNRLSIVASKKLPELKGIQGLEAILKKLQTLPTILYKIEDQVVEDFLHQFKIDYHKLNVVRVFPHYRSVHLMIANQIGWGVVPNHIEFDQKDFHIFELSGKSKDVREYSICYRKEIRDSLVIKDFLQLLLN